MFRGGEGDLGRRGQLGLTSEAGLAWWRWEPSPGGTGWLCVAGKPTAPTLMCFQQPFIIFCLVALSVDRVQLRGSHLESLTWFRSDIRASEDAAGLGVRGGSLPRPPADTGCRGVGGDCPLEPLPVASLRASGFSWPGSGVPGTGFPGASIQEAEAAT